MCCLLCFLLRWALAARAQGMMTQSEGGKEIHKFVKDSSEALKVSKVATNWKAYVDFAAWLVCFCACLGQRCVSTSVESWGRK